MTIRRRGGMALLASLAVAAGMALSGLCAAGWLDGVRSHEAQSARQTAAGVALSLRALLRQDLDFVDSLRGLMTMEPHLTPSGFDAWYAALQGRSRQVAGVGSGVLELVSPARQREFDARRDADPAFRALLGGWIEPPPLLPGARACLLAAGSRLIPPSPLTAALEQSDWCSPRSMAGRWQRPLLAAAAASGQVLAVPVRSAIVNTTFLEAAFYRTAAALVAPAERLAATRGWIVSSFDIGGLIRAALGRSRSLRVVLEHSNPGQPYELIGSSGARRGRPVGSWPLSADGRWLVRIAAVPARGEMSAGAQAGVVLAAGILLTLLVVTLGVVLARSREAALWMVEARTSELRHQALHDALTGLPNRRALLADLEAAIARRGPGQAVTLALFDLNGFKDYNDSRGHVAGDELLARLGSRLASGLKGAATAYRMGGDEFCLLALSEAEAGRALGAQGAELLSEHSPEVSAAHGIAQIPADADSALGALRVADARMYELKGARASASRQSAGVLLAALEERDPDLGEHLYGVAALAIRTAERLGLPPAEVRLIGAAAELHDVGKLAIPDRILHKPAALDELEWEVMRLHTEIGERIVTAAPALAPLAGLVRSSHERYDGGGYPDGLAGEQVPLGAYVIAACDALDAMTTKRVYRDPIDAEEALCRLRAGAGSQFHPRVVEVLCELLGGAGARARRKLKIAAFDD